MGRLKANGHRFVANHGDQNTLRQLGSASKEQVGRAGWVRNDKEKIGRNLFVFEQTVKL